MGPGFTLYAFANFPIFLAYGPITSLPSSGANHSIDLTVSPIRHHVCFLSASAMVKIRLWQWMMLLGVFVAAFLLRAHNVSRVFLWLDETDMFNEYVYGAHPKSLVEFAMYTRDATTVTWGWPGIIWIVSRLFGPTIGVARMATVVVSAIGVPMLFFLVYRLLPD